MASSRRAHLDWLRGVAVLCMIEWHVLSAWTRPADAQGTPWLVIAFIGGCAAPLFLFLAGVAVPFAIAGHVGRGAGAERAAWLVQRRGWQVFGIAHLFRLQSFLFNPRASWSYLFKPDILNILGLGLAGTAWLASRGRRVSWLLGSAVVVLVLTPWSRLWWWPTLLHPRLEAYIRPNGYGVFELFPWVAFVPAGALVGLLLAAPRDAAAERRLHHRLALAGAGLAIIGYSLGAIPLPSGVAFWTGAWARFLFAIGLMTTAVWLGWLWMRWPLAASLSGPLVLFGRTSLFVYWVHVELAFGILSYPLHAALPLAWSLAGFAGMTALMAIAAAWWEARPGGAWIPERLRAQ